jgi:DNA-binding response OmpR family regulator
LSLSCQRSQHPRFIHIADRIKGLELGADDYLIGPFSFAELVARLRTLIRRGPTREEKQLHIEDLQIDARKRRVTRTAFHVGAAAGCDLLILLLAHPSKKPSMVRVMT